MVKRLPRKKVVPHYWLFLIIFLFLIIGAVGLWQMVKGSHWDGKSRINLALSSELVCLASFSPKEEELMFLIIPQGTELEVISGYGKYRVEAVGKLEEQEKREGLLAESLQENLGVPVEGWIKTNNKQQTINNKGGLLEELKSQVLGRGKTNLSKWDILRLWWQVRTLRFNRVESVDLSKISVLLRSSLPDGTQIWKIDKASLDAYLGKTLNDRDIRGESLGVEVLNGTSYPGLAEGAARLLTNIGGEVVWVGNSETKSQSASWRTKVKSQKSKKSSYTVQRIIKIFNAEWEEKEEEGRGEVTLILGEDYWEKLNQK